jgi:hypothetical protein
MVRQRRLANLRSELEAQDLTERLTRLASRISTCRPARPMAIDPTRLRRGIVETDARRKVTRAAMLHIRSNRLNKPAARRGSVIH